MGYHANMSPWKIKTDKSTGWFSMNVDEDEYKLFFLGGLEALALRSLCSVVSLISFFLQFFLLDVVRRRRWRYGFECSRVLRTVYCNLPVIKNPQVNTHTHTQVSLLLSCDHASKDFNAIPINRYFHQFKTSTCETARDTWRLHWHRGHSMGNGRRWGDLSAGESNDRCGSMGVRLGNCWAISIQIDFN